MLDKIFGRLGNRLFQSAYIYAQFKRGEIPDIYVQSPEYFEDYADEIKQLFGQAGEKIDMVAIHVRRTDYCNNPFYTDLMETPYYRDAMAQFPDAQFLVFSDDPIWCGLQDIFKRCEISYGTEMEDFNRMAQCSGHIIANSSYSWWAAYLAPYTKKVIAPKSWYSDGIIRTVIPKEWLAL